MKWHGPVPKSDEIFKLSKIPLCACSWRATSSSSGGYHAPQSKPGGENGTNHGSLWTWYITFKDCHTDTTPFIKSLPPKRWCRIYRPSGWRSVNGDMYCRSRVIPQEFSSGSLRNRHGDKKLQCYLIMSSRSGSQLQLIWVVHFISIH